MSTHEQITNNPTSAVRNTGGRNGPQGLEEPMSDEILREVCDKNYHQLLPLIAEKMQKEKERKDKLNAVKARLIYGEESGIKIRSRGESHYSESKTPTARAEPRRRHGDRSPHRSPGRHHLRKEGGVFNRLGRKEPVTSARSDSRRRSPQAKRTEVETRRHQQRQTPSRATSQYSESEDSEGGPRESKTRSRNQTPMKIISMEPWTLRKEIFHYFDPAFSLPRTYDCHSHGKLSSANKAHQRSGGDTSHQAKRRRIYGGLHGKIQGISPGRRSHGRKKASSSWKPSEGGDKPTFKKGFKNKQRSDRRPDRFSLLTKTPKEIFALEKGKFKAPPPMVTPVEKRDPSKYCEFHSNTGHNTNECMQLRKQIDEMIKAAKLSQFIKELKQNDKPKAPKKGDASGKDKPLTILDPTPRESSGPSPYYPGASPPETQYLFPYL
ncbi:hypothetical protein Tco_0396192 [Tanacetum coccineum]